MELNNNPFKVDQGPKLSNCPDRAELVYKIFNTLYQDVKTPADLPGLTALGKQMIAEIDEIAMGSIRISFRMESEDKLDAFWQFYQTGGLVSLISRDILTSKRKLQLQEEAKNYEVELRELRLGAFIKERDYIFVKNAVRSKNGKFVTCPVSHFERKIIQKTFL